MEIIFKIYRSHHLKKRKSHYDRFHVPYQKGMTVLDVIQYVHKHIDSTLAYRYECRQGVCGTCGVMLDKKPVLSCSTQIDPNVKIHVIEPLANFPVEKDLIVDLKPLLTKYLKIKPFLDRAHNVLITKSKANESKAYRKCIECGCCVSAVTTIKKKNGKEVIDPMSLVKVARYYTDPRDGLDRKTIAEKSGVQSYSDKVGKKLSGVCPRGIPIDEAIRILKD